MLLKKVDNLRNEVTNQAVEAVVDVLSEAGILVTEKYKERLAEAIYDTITFTLT